MSVDTFPPDPTNPDLLDNLRDYLITQGLVRDPRDGSQPSLPPLWIANRFGTPAPGQKEGLHPIEVGQDLVAEIKPTTDVPSARFEGFIRNNHIEFVIRARIPPKALHFENQVRAAINDRRNWMMGAVQVNESLLVRGLQPIGSDNTGFTYSCEYLFCLWAPFAVVGQ